jgi:large subunit ribosomal protein L22
MEFISEQKYIRMSPKKIRPILREIKHLPLDQVLSLLPFVRKRGAVWIEKVIKSAIANARQKGVEPENLKIKEIVANSGPVLKRGNPVSRGQWHPIKKRMTHLRVILVSQDSKASQVKEEKKEIKETNTGKESLPEVKNEKIVKDEKMKKVGKKKVSQAKKEKKNLK